jgi:ketosteroid isomerase-like protein
MGTISREGIMAAADDLETIRAGYEAFGRGDIPAVLEKLDPEIAWHIPGRSPMAGTYKGYDEIVGFFTQLMERSGGTFSLEMHDLMASDGHVVALTKERGQRDGRDLDSNVVHIWHMRAGKAVEFFGVSQDLYASDEFWS